MSLATNLVLLGICLDFDLDTGRVVSWKRPHWLCANPEGTTLVVIPAPRVRRERLPTAAASNRLYEDFHDFAPDRMSEVTVKVAEPEPLGHCVRIGYRSDKWSSSRRMTDYTHDFRHPPRVTKEGQVYRLRGAIKVRPAGITG